MSNVKGKPVVMTDVSRSSLLLLLGRTEKLKEDETSQFLIQTAPEGLHVIGTRLRSVMYSYWT